MAKRKPPSQIRYEKSHPTISFRLDEELKSRLENVLEGESFASFVKEALGKREREKGSLKKEYDKGYNNGYEEGYNQAKDDFGVYVECVLCGGKMIVNKEYVKEELAKHLIERGVHHTQCIEKRHRRRMEGNF